MKTNEKIRQLRENRKWTQEEMAHKLNMSTQGYAKIERGDTRSNINRLEQISKIFGMDIIELLSYGENVQFQFNNSTNTDSFNNTFFGSSQYELQFEIEKMRLIIEHQKEIIDNLKRENNLLQEINRLTKKE